MQPKHHNSYKKTLHKQTDACVLTDKCLLFYTGAPQCRSLVTKLSFCSFNFFTLGCLIRFCYIQEPTQTKALSRQS